MKRESRLISFATAMMAMVGVVVLHNSFAPHTDTCADPDRLRSMALFDGVRQLQTLIDQEPDQPLWIDGTLGAESLSDHQYSFRFIRSYDVARFLQAGLLLLRNFPLPLDGNARRVLDVDGEAVPIRIRVRQTGNSPFVTGYLVAIGNEPVANPAPGTLRRIFTAPFRGPKPVTILLIESPRPEDGLEEQEAFIQAWLSAGWREYLEICDPRA